MGLGGYLRRQDRRRALRLRKAREKDARRSRCRTRRRRITQIFRLMLPEGGCQGGASIRRTAGAGDFMMRFELGSSGRPRCRVSASPSGCLLAGGLVPLSAYFFTGTPARTPRVHRGHPAGAPRLRYVQGHLHRAPPPRSAWQTAVSAPRRGRASHPKFMPERGQVLHCNIAADFYPVCIEDLTPIAADTCFSWSALRTRRCRGGPEVEEGEAGGPGNPGRAPWPGPLSPGGPPALPRTRPCGMAGNQSSG